LELRHLRRRQFPDLQRGRRRRNDSGEWPGSTSGKTVLDAGDYHSVQINTEGQDWSLTITPGNSTN
jgi:hypothetical protein